ncbi:ATP-binding protein [Streptomyces sp. NPDC088254]|uniref:ATP-binding protein n=1 Tax=Streptomyces sp. NPDC088254 TaxID=3365847 RepID=UPI0038271C8F
MNAQKVSAALGLPSVDESTVAAPSLGDEPLPGREPNDGKEPTPVRPQSWKRSWRAEACVPRLARLHARTRLSMMSWSGDQDSAVRIATEVVRNAVQHVGSGVVELRLSVDQDEVLFLDVTDAHPGDGGLDGALAGRDGTGLWLVRRLGGEVSWVPAESGNGKTIRIRVPPGEIGTTTSPVDAP